MHFILRNICELLRGIQKDGTRPPGAAESGRKRKIYPDISMNCCEVDVRAVLGFATLRAECTLSRFVVQ